MGVEDRPYVGTWRLNQHSVVRHTPDCLVYVNGNLEVPGCRTCSGRIDLQKFITSVTVDPTLQPPATAQITMQIPRHFGDDLFRDGQFLLEAGLEVHIYMRGYFPVSDMLRGAPVDSEVDFTRAVLYPYYLVHHGVVTEVSHEYSGGEHTASLSCADLLHFWQYQRVATNASVFGNRPTNSKVQPNLVGHKLNGMTPYGIIYNLWRDSFGEAGGVEFAMGNETNSAASSSGLNSSLWSFMIRYWEQRFSESMMSLRMYGADGSLYNCFEQAFLATLAHSQFQDLAKYDFSQLPAKPTSDFEKTALQARALGWDKTSVRLGGASEADAQGNNLGINVTQMQAFVHDVSQWGQVNLWESKYETKLDIAKAVSQITGFEFFMDVDGDLVFKPPFYNLDTKDAPAYRIRPVDIRSISFRETEPEATTVKGTGGAFSNIQVGLTGEWGIRAEYLDYRLVAKYGWRQETFETQYYGDPRAMFFSAVNRMDLFNIGVRSASVQIPVRPELRPGYPVYIEHLDVYGYIQSMNHSHQFGGECTTTLNLVGIRAKFMAPGEAGDGEPAGVANLDLAATTMPKLPLQLIGDDGHPRLVGVPNVVMALDPETINPLFFVVGADLENLATTEGINILIRAARLSGRLSLGEAQTEMTPEQQWLQGPFMLHSGQDDGTVVEIQSPQQVLEQVQSIRDAQNNPYDGETQAEREATLEAAHSNASQFYELVRAAGGPVWTDIPDGKATWNYLDALNDMKASFNPGAALPGYYRYYTASLEDQVAQGMPQFIADEEAGGIPTTGEKYALETPVTIKGLVDREGQVQIGDVTCRYGIPLAAPTSTEARDPNAPPPDPEVTATHLIQTLSFAQHTYTKMVMRTYFKSGSLPTADRGALEAGMEALFRSSQTTSAAPETLFAGIFDEVAAAAATVYPTVSVSWASFQADNPVVVIGPQEIVNDAYVREMAIYITDACLGAINGVNADLEAEWGSVRADPPSGRTFEDKVAAWDGAGQRVNDLFAALDEVRGGGHFLNTSEGHGLDTGNSLVPETKSVYTPVFPVSDADGYEVVGSYRYGRGLSVLPGGSWEQLTMEDGFSWSDINSVENFVRELGSGRYAPVGEGGTLDAETAAALAEQEGVPQSRIIAPDGDGRTVFEQRLMNRPANVGTERVFKITAVNAAYSLADMGVTLSREVCECKGAQADLFLQAFAEGGEAAYVEVEQPDSVSQWLSNQMVEASTSWAENQGALRGEYEEQTSGLLTAAVEQLTDSERRASLVENASSSIDQEVGTIQEELGDG